MRYLFMIVGLMSAPALGAGEHLPIPRFADPGRRAKLEAALPDIEKVFENFWRNRQIPGLIYGVVIDGEVATIRSFGVRERVSNSPVTPDTVFRIASMTKSFTALAILRLRDEGKLSLEDPVSKWIPELTRWEYPTRDTAPLRIRQLLTHGAGFPEDNPWGDRQLAAGEEVLTRWLEKGIPFSTPPDTAFEYSNYGFALLGRIVEKASGEPYRGYLQGKILLPLAMGASTLEPDAVSPALRATGYRLSGKEYFEEPSLRHGAFGAMGGLLTSARDLGRYVAYQLSAFPPRDEAERGPVRRSSLREMQQLWRSDAVSGDRPTPEGQINPTVAGYGYGLRIIQDCRFRRRVGHGGGLPGFGSYMAWLPHHGVGIFAMANLTYAGPFPALLEAFEVLRRTGALKPREWPPSPALLAMREALVKLWNRWEDGEAAALAADNLFQDVPAAERQREIERLKSDLGRCAADGGFQPENLLRGTFRMSCERGLIDVLFTLSPTLPPRLQSLRFAPIKPEEASKPQSGDTPCVP